MDESFRYRTFVTSRLHTCQCTLPFFCKNRRQRTLPIISDWSAPHRENHTMRSQTCIHDVHSWNAAFRVFSGSPWIDDNDAALANSGDRDVSATVCDRGGGLCDSVRSISSTSSLACEDYNGFSSACHWQKWVCSWKSFAKRTEEFCSQLFQTWVQHFWHVFKQRQYNIHVIHSLL